MRFCMVSNFYPPYHFGGDATYVRALSRALVARGHEVEVVHCEDAYRIKRKGRKQFEPVEEDGITTHRLKSPWGFLSPLITHQTGRPGLKSKPLRKILDRGFDVVHFHNISLIGGPAVLQLSRAPVTLYTPQDQWLLCPTHFFWKNRSRVCDRPTCFSCSIRSGIPPQLWRYSRLVQHSLAAVDALIAPSTYIAQKHSEAGIKRPIHVIPSFSALDPGPAPDYSPPKRHRFVFVGRVTATKGVVPLLELFARWPDYDLWIVGDGDLRPQLQSQYAGHKNIRFYGPVPQAELVTKYQDATALVFPSLAPESFGLTIVEAFACGTPAIVRESGGASEMIESTGGGLVYRTEAELTDAVKRLAEDSLLRRELGRKARAGFKRCYTPERHLNRYLKCIDEIQHRKGITSH